MTRQITSHMVNGCNEDLHIVVCDEPSNGGANHYYQIVNVSKQNREPDGDYVTCEINFQKGPIPEVGTNGVTHEALIAILIDRLQGFQKGPFSCRENALALTKLEEAMHWLQHRTVDRLRRNVEGTHQK